MTLPADAVDPTNPVQVAQWMQRVEDDLKHVHECIERRDSEARQRDLAQEELNESRHQQNTGGLREIRDALKPLSLFMENATTQELVQGAVAGERARVRTKSQERRSQLRHAAIEAGKYVAPGGLLAGLVKLLS